MAYIFIILFVLSLKKLKKTVATIVKFFRDVDFMVCLLETLKLARKSE